MMVREVLDSLLSVSVGGDVHVHLKNTGGNTTSRHWLGPVLISDALASALWSTLRTQQSPVSQRNH